MPLGGLVAGGIGAVTSLVGGLLGSSASSKAAAIQAKNAQTVAGMAESATQGGQKGVGDAAAAAPLYVNQGATTANQTLSPYTNAGSTTLGQLTQALQPGGSLGGQFSFDPNQVANNPGYQFQLQQGLQAVQRAAAATGGLNSGGTLKALNNYAQGAAASNEQQYYNQALGTYQTNFQNTLGSLMGVSQLGLNPTLAASQNTYNAGLYQGNTAMNAAEFGANLGLQGTQIAGQALTGGANAQAAGTIGSANAWSGALGGIANAAQGVATNYTLGNLMSSYYGNGGYNTGGSTTPGGAYIPNAGGGYGGTPTLNVSPNSVPYQASAPPTTLSGYIPGYSSGYLQ